MKKQPTYPDHELFEQIKQGSTTCLEVLFERYYNRLCEFAEIFVKSPDFAQEIVSDVFLKLWEKKEHIIIHKNLKTYLFTSTRNHCLNFLKKEKVQLEQLDSQASLPSQQAEAEASMNYNELMNAFEKLVEEMPSQRKTVYKLNKIEGLKYKEIAELLSISITTVQSHMVKANKFMTEKFVQIHPLSLIFYFLVFPFL
ncbi:RNA polymerase sigma-70 factor [Rapidithrix thailandica]|uniref:RNA polymerase sigma-70 factor n=1 Tax=Rapidithrix thailandica TaxID=413964 RepID=A0AAW9S1Q1_9BACT